MARKPQVLDRWGNPLKRSEMSREVAAPTIGGVRSPISGYPADGLNPIRLAQILREADQGNPLRYLELAETIEERDPHYLAVISTRKRSVAQIGISVEPAGDSAQEAAHADMVNDWLKRDELSEELFHILDCIGKGYSFTEIIWETSEGQYYPKELKRRDQRWFRFNRVDLETPMKLTAQGQEVPLDAFRFIYANIQAKSGLALRSGLARVAAWGWMFKAFTQRDWAIFTQTYGQPLRVGKFGKGASEEDQNTLFQAVANIAGDCAAIIPASMEIDFVESKNVGSSVDLYESRSNWLDQQISKAVLGQTATTDAIAGGHAVGQEHRQVQEDIERADAKALSGILNRDLIRPWIIAEFGPQKNYPRLKIERPEVEDLAALSTALGILVPLGLRVKARQISDKFGLDEPGENDEILGQTAQPDSEDANAPEPTDPASILKRVSGKIKRGEEAKGTTTALNAQQPSVALKIAPDPVADLADQLAQGAETPMQAMLETIEAMIQSANSLGEIREMLLAGFPKIASDDLAALLAEAMSAAHLGGRAMLEEESD